MFTATPTKHLTGILLQGDYLDFTELEQALNRMMDLDEDKYGLYWGVLSRMQDLREKVCMAYMGLEEISLAENGMDRKRMHQHGIIMPAGNVQYGVKILFPEAVFLALAIPSLFDRASIAYGRNQSGDYHRDRAMLEFWCATVLHALAEIIGDRTLEMLLRYRNKPGSHPFDRYVSQYVDLCNIDYLHTPVASRPAMLNILSGRLMAHQAVYQELEQMLEEGARAYHCSIYDLQDTRLVYPEEILW